MDSTALIRAEIRLDAIAHNIRQLRQITRPGARLLAAVKANAYGHGAVPVAETVLENGADALGVARLEEAVQLRKAGIRAPILIFGYTPPHLADVLIRFDLTQAVYDPGGAKALSDAAAGIGKRVRVHLKVDTGMGRVGLFNPFTGDEDADCPSPATISGIMAISRRSHLHLDGIFTHFATSDSADKSYARLQLRRFIALTDALKASGLHDLTRHAANSGAIIDMPESHLDMVRAGITIYGLYPSDEVRRSAIDLKPAMQIVSTIIQIKPVPAGFKVSYGATWQAAAPTTIATVAVGYGDGYNRLLSNQGQMLVRGQAAPVAGRVCMDLTMIDVGHIPDAAVGDKVVVLGRQGGKIIGADEIARCIGTINYEVVTAVSSRVPRVYSGRMP